MKTTTLNVTELSQQEMMLIDGGIMIGLLIICFAAGVAIGLGIV